MKKLMSLLGAILTLLFIALPSFAQDKEFCWKDSTPRGVGTVPEACEAGRERIGLLCYSKCPAGTKRSGFDCHSVCPDGMRDDGLFCRAAEYGRGAGYPLKFGELNLDGARARCAAENPQGCEQNGVIIYPKCKAGYEAFGCCICRPKQPNCSALGMNPGVDLSCAKKVTIGDPVTGACSSSQQKDAGLCYPQCSSGYTGVGPVCWGQAPKGWVECGMGAAKDSLTCAKIIGGQVASVGFLAMNIASLGTSTSLTAGMSAPDKASRLAKVTQEFTKLKTQWDVLVKTNQQVKTAVDVFNGANAARKGYVALNTLSNITTEEDMIRAAAQMAAILDPSGVASVVGAYTYPKCSKYFPNNIATK